VLFVAVATFHSVSSSGEDDRNPTARQRGGEFAEPATL